ncbi:hypothetical protein HBN50_00640 [Halobacteriovorax sp. GB3]|uniref:M48 family metalloprotease n=1 Tax=Halobacteriovorax sp. GB3 TaxID=2719615 RepID=UPI002360E5D1|nr:M48 family metalloprotease [Halobacteriovorax sp. GB3]MDD0851573.1 hypothetical protein [Halobacteriovorax sp. GB3]
MKYTTLLLVFFISTTIFSKMRTDHLIPMSDEQYQSWLLSDGSWDMPYPEETDEYIKGRKYLDKVFKIFKAQYPQFKDLKSPALAVVSGDGASVSGYTTEQPYGVKLTTGLLKKPEEEIMFVIAHELVHLYSFHNSLSGDGELLGTYHKDDRIDCNPQANTEELEKFKEYFRLFNLIGTHLDDELQGIPYSFWGGDSNLAGELFHYLMLSMDQEKESCQVAQEAFMSWKWILSKNYNAKNDSFDLKKTDFDKQLKLFVSSAKVCFEDEKVDFKELVGQSLDISQRGYERLLFAGKSEKEKKVIKKLISNFNKEENVINAILTFSKSVSDEMKVIEDVFDDFHFYSTEDEADMIATKILTKSGFNIEKSLDYWLADLSKEGKKECLEQLEKGIAPKAARSDSVHQRPCYRAYRIKKYYEAIK